MLLALWSKVILSMNRNVITHFEKYPKNNYSNNNYSNFSGRPRDATRSGAAPMTSRPLWGSNATARRQSSSGRRSSRTDSRITKSSTKRCTSSGPSDRSRESTATFPSPDWRVRPEHLPFRISISRTNWNITERKIVECFPWISMKR